MLVVTKDEVRESNSAYAQGGIAGVLDPEDHFEDHIADTLAAGKGLCDPEVVELVVREAPRRIAELIDWGTHFDQVDGQVALTREGGHSHARIVHALGDATGRDSFLVRLYADEVGMVGNQIDLPVECRYPERMDHVERTQFNIDGRPTGIWISLAVVNRCAGAPRY